MSISSNTYNYAGRNLRLFKETNEELVKELFCIKEELESDMYPVSAARAEELYKKKSLIQNELTRRGYHEEC